MGEGEASGRSLALTPTWAIAAICTAIVLVSFAAERTIYQIGVWLKKTKQKAWRQALDKMKEELMLLGFISLTITVTQSYIVKICLPAHVLTTWTPCSPRDPGTPTCQEPSTTPESPSTKELLEHVGFLSQVVRGRALADEVPGSDPCQGACKAGHQPLVSLEGIHQLHIFVFIMACVHVFYSAVTMFLSMAKIRSWKKWEEEAQAETHDSLTEITKSLTLKRQSTFVRYHTSKPWSRMRLVVWIICFFRQFFESVTRADYFALRLGFLTNHNLDRTFNFYSYMVRSMEEEFKVIVGISGFLWIFVVVFLLFNVHGSNLYFWIALVPPVLLLMVGTKLQHIIATLALENARVHGPLFHRVRPRDELFWFGWPELLLGLIHFILFQNAFELATFFWFWWQFSLSSCFFEHTAFSAVRLSLGFVVQIVAGYSTLPLYAIVSQMGSNYKLGESVKGTLHKWRKRAKGKLGSLQEEDEPTDRADDGSIPSPPTSRHGGSGGVPHGPNTSSESEQRREIQQVGPIRAGANVASNDGIRQVLQISEGVPSSCP